MESLEEVINQAVTTTITGTMEVAAGIFELFPTTKFTGQEVATILRSCGNEQRANHKTNGEDHNEHR